jgi:hypothetical protein
MVNKTVSREHNNGGLVDGASRYRSHFLQYTTLAALEANDGLDVIALHKWYGEHTKCDYYDWGTRVLDMNCGPHDQRLLTEDRQRQDYMDILGVDILGVLGAIPHLTTHAYEIDRIDNTVGYSLRNMLRCCFKHNCFIRHLQHSFCGARLSAGKLRARLRPFIV